MTEVMVGRVADFPPGSARVVTLRGQDVAVFNDRGTFHALIDRCPP